MNEETTNVKAKLDLTSFSDKELENLVPMIEKELGKRRETRRKDAVEKMRAIAESVGMTPEELLGLKEPVAPKAPARSRHAPDYPVAIPMTRPRSIRAGRSPPG